VACIPIYERPGHRPYGIWGSEPLPNSASSANGDNDRTIQKPRKIWVVNVWRRTQRKEINREAKIIAERENTPRSKLAAVRNKVARELFERLSKEEQQQWVEQANEEHNAAVAKWKEETEGRPSTMPVDRQR